MTLQRAGIDALERELRDASPYPGLRPFYPDEARYFMGRETQIREIIGRLGHQSCVTVLGGSGCGKSSIVRAGVIPALRLKLIPGRGDFWRVATCTPGRAPMDNLVAALAGVLVPGSSAERSTRIREVLYGPSALGGFLPAFKTEIAIDPALSADVLEGANVLIVIDQFEELFREENIGQAQAAALAELVIDCWRRREQNPGLFLVLTMRTDDLHRCAEFIDLPDVINATGYLTRRLKEDELREAIVAPVRPPMFRAGLLEGALAPGEADLRPYEVRVVTEVLDAVEEIAYDPDHLPLLQHLLAILWRTALERWRREADQGSAEAEARITEADLARALGFNAWGDLVKARERAYADNRRGWLLRHCLEHVADELYQGGLFGAPLTAAQQEIARTGFCLMGEVDNRGNFKRRWTTREEIARVAGLPAPGPDIDAFIRRFTRDHRLLWVRESGDMDVSHESLMRNWSRLAGWLTENKEAGAAYRLLFERSVNWTKIRLARFWWLSWLQKKRRHLFLSEDDLERIEPLLTPQRKPKYNISWSERFVSPNGHMAAILAANQTEIERESSRDMQFINCFNYLKWSRRHNAVRRHAVLVIIFASITILGYWAAWEQRESAERERQIAERAVSVARQQQNVAEQQERLSETSRNVAAISLWSGLQSWQPVPNSDYVGILWELAKADDDNLRIAFLRHIKPGGIGRQMGFRPQPIIRAIGLIWPEEARKIVSEKVATAVKRSELDHDPRTAPGLACAIAALRDQLPGDTLERAKASFEAYLTRAGTRAREVWSKARILACLGPELPRKTRADLLKEIVQTVEKEAPGSEGFERMGVVAAAAMAAWERKADEGPLSPDDLKASSEAVAAAINSLKQADPFMAISISRSLVSLIAALPGDEQPGILSDLLGTVNDLPEGNVDPDVLLILAQAFELVAEQHSSDEGAKELAPLTDQAEQLLTGADTKIGIARLITPLAKGRTGMLEELLRVAGVVAAPDDAADELLHALAEVGGKRPTAGADPRELQAGGLRIGLQGRLLALLVSGGKEGLGDGRVDPVRTLSDVTDDVGRTGRGGEPLLAEPQQHFAREGLARAFAALAPSLDKGRRMAALKVAKRELASTGSAEEAAAWATAISNLLADREDGAAVEEIVDVLKYPTAALTAREPNAKKPRNATDIFAKTLADRLKLVKPLQELLNSAKGRFPDLDLMKRPERPPKLDGSASGPW
jgi:hypothetical protein